MKTLFRIIAFLEGVSYILLMSVGLYFKYQLADPSYIKLLGMPHGLLFISYLILAFLIKMVSNGKTKILELYYLLQFFLLGHFMLIESI